VVLQFRVRGDRISSLAPVVGWLVLLPLAACDPRPLGDPPEVVEARVDAARGACIGRELLAGAEESLDALRAFQAEETVDLGITHAAMEFARAYHAHAQLRATELAYADSAVNHARSSADSLRYEQAASAFLPRAPEPGTLEGNVADAWLRDFTTIGADEDHRCNWDI
jgi:hypothetical protein